MQSKEILSPLAFSFNNAEDRETDDKSSCGLFGSCISKQSNIRGFFSREQLDFEEIQHLNENKRKTKEFLDSQIEEKRQRQQNQKIIKFRLLESPPHMSNILEGQTPTKEKSIIEQLKKSLVGPPNKIEISEQKSPTSLKRSELLIQKDKFQLKINSQVKLENYEPISQQRERDYCEERKTTAPEQSNFYQNTKSKVIVRVKSPRNKIIASESSKRLTTEILPQNIDMQMIQDILFENQQLKQNLEYKQQIIEMLIRPQPLKPSAPLRFKDIENVRQLAMKEIKENEKANMNLTKKKMYFSPESNEQKQRIVLKLQHSPDLDKKEKINRINQFKSGKISCPMSPDSNKRIKILEKKSSPDLMQILMNASIKRKLTFPIAPEPLYDQIMTIQRSKPSCLVTLPNEEYLDVEKPKLDKQGPNINKFKFMKEFSTNLLTKKFCC